MTTTDTRYRVIVQVQELTGDTSTVVGEWAIGPLFSGAPEAITHGQKVRAAGDRCKVTTTSRRARRADDSQDTLRVIRAVTAEGAVTIQWKDEDSIHGDPVGPAYVVLANGDRRDIGWRTRSAVEQLAAQYSLRLDVF